MGFCDARAVGPMPNRAPRATADRSGRALQPGTVGCDQDCAAMRFRNDARWLALPPSRRLYCTAAWI